ncbi:MAG: rffA [Solirubrobacterales bacterium]|nr:rffA [Solirubrobacterales bacterium]
MAHTDAHPFAGRAALADSRDPAGAPTRSVPFLRPTTTEAGVAAVAAAARAGLTKAGGPATRRCERLLRAHHDVDTVVMTHSCTGALELSALLLGIGEGDEVIMPSFAFASSANAFVLRGATPVFVDVQADTMNIDPAAVRAALTPRTRALVVVHYAGVAAAMDELLAIARDAGIALVEDAAQALGSSHRGRPLGSLGTLGTISFDATKNLSSGTGGALLVNDPAFAAEAELLRDYGTDRARFARGEIARYRWVQAGSNLAMNELAAAYLAPQLEHLERITQRRRRIWRRYHDAFAEAERAGLVRRPVVPETCEDNAHIYALTTPTAEGRTRLLHELAADGVEAAFHYVPLHSAPAGRRHGRVHGSMRNTDEGSARLLRLPLWDDMPAAAVEQVIAAVLARLAFPSRPAAVPG